MSSSIYTDISIQNGTFYIEDCTEKKKSTKELLLLIQEIALKRIPWGNPPEQTHKKQLSEALKEKLLFQETNHILLKKANQIYYNYLNKPFSIFNDFKINEIHEIHVAIVDLLFIEKLDTFPEELLLHICSFITDLGPVALINKRLNRIVKTALSRKDGIVTTVGNYLWSLNQGLKTLSEIHESLKSHIKYTSPFPFLSSIILEASFEEIKKNIKKTSLNKELKQSLLTFSSQGNIHCVRVLLELGIDPNTKNNKGKTALHLSVKNNYYEVSRVLLYGKADPNKLDNSKKTPIFYAKIEIIISLLRRFRAHIDITDDSETVLHIAVKTNDFKRIQALLLHGANPKIQDKQQNKPLKYAQSEKVHELLHLYEATHEKPS